MWDIVGGHREGDETAPQALTREVNDGLIARIAEEGFATRHAIGL